MYEFCVPYSRNFPINLAFKYCVKIFQISFHARPMIGTRLNSRAVLWHTQRKFMGKTFSGQHIQFSVPQMTGEIGKNLPLKKCFRYLLVFKVKLAFALPMFLTSTVLVKACCRNQRTCECAFRLVHNVYMLCMACTKTHMHQYMHTHTGI